MKKPLSLALVIVGLILLAYGFNAADSLSSGFSKLFTGSPSEKAIWLQISGALCLIVGAIGLFRSK